MPSDYDRQAELNYMEYDEIKDILTKEVEQRNLAKVKIVLLVNVCGAGNAVEDGATEMSVPIEDKYIQQAVNWISEFRVGQADLAVIPATPRGRNTFEKDGSSIFARHLIEAFDGAAAGPDDQLTTGEIFAYLKTALGENLPRNPEFANDIVVGETSRARGRDHLVLGTALMGAARAIQDPDIARILQDLASFHFDEVRGRNPELAARARLRKLQVGVLAQSITDVAAKAKEIPKNALTQVERGELQTLLEVGSSLRYPTFADYLADLEADPKARVLILRPSLTMASDVDVEGLLKLRFGQEKVYAGDISDLSGLTDFLATPTTDTPPLVVYSGSEGGAGCSVVEEKCQFAHPWETILASLRESNGGPFVFVFSAPFGGALAEIAPKDIMLYLPASQRNGMLWRGADESSAGILFEGIADRFSDAQLAENLRSFHSSFSNSEFAPGEPMWRQGGVDPRPAIVKSLAPLDELSLLSSLGCLDLDLPSCASRETLTGSRLFDALEAAASADMKGDMPDARSGYLSVHNAIDALPDGVEALGAVKVRADFEDLATVIGARLSDFLGPGDRNFVIVPIGVEDYLSPLIGDVPHALNDLAVYSDRLTMAIQRSAGNGEATINQIKVLPTFEPRTA
ncbi:hypothetical protein [Primorskyibacter sp. 2E233]|uniref:hypothetical protein n=1 Tax=Primorskyibacter sp. 2E233 TaxID=3413431 RepID=UPI003BEFC6EB